MIGRILCVGIIGFVVSSSRATAQALPPGFARNPYGVAGRGQSMTYLNMPKTSPLYFWHPYWGARYITVRPYCPPRDCYGAGPDGEWNYFFWDNSAKTIGRSDAERLRFDQYVRAHLGKVWIIGNEPDSYSQDNLSPTDYATMYHAYYVRVRQLDPSAKFAIASITGSTFVREFDAMRTYYEAVFSEYRRLYQAALAFDYWNIHAYYAGWLPHMPREPQAMTNAVFERIINPYLQYRLSAQSGQYASKPILATEVGLALPENNQLGLSESQIIEFMRVYTGRLATLVAQGIVTDFFWFYGGYTSFADYAQSNLLQPDEKTPSALGRAYVQEARAWDRQFGLEQADSNQDTKIGILDFSGLVKVFGTTNALLSLDTDPRITRADLAIFKQVFNLAN